MPITPEQLEDSLKSISLTDSNETESSAFFDNLLSMKADKHNANKLIKKIFTSRQGSSLSRPGTRSSQRSAVVRHLPQHDETIDGIDLDLGSDGEVFHEVGEPYNYEDEQSDYEDFQREYEVSAGRGAGAAAGVTQVLPNQTRAAAATMQGPTGAERFFYNSSSRPTSKSSLQRPRSRAVSVNSMTVPCARSLSSDELDLATSAMAAGQCFKSYHHATWYVSNAKQTAQYFITAFGFKKIAYKGLETGCKGFAGHVVQNGGVTFEFVSPICSDTSVLMQQQGGWILEEMHNFIKKHGDGVKDVSFEVSDVDLVFKHAIRAGAKAICEPRILSDEFGSIKKATIQVFEDIFHTLIEVQDYKGVYLPNYRAVENNGFTDEMHGSALSLLPPVKLDVIDHCVQNKDWNMMDEGCDVYSKVFGFHQFWSVDENDVSTEFSALRSMVMASSNDVIKMPINEPAEGLCRSQIEEFLDFYDGPGVQHIAVATPNIIESVRNMKARGAEFISVPELYYENLLPRLLATGIHIQEDLDKLKELGILIDFDENGYLLQIFTKPLADRPTFFLEIIQRHNHNGFGKGNFKALFQTIEQEQRLRGTLEKSTGEPQQHKVGAHKDMVLEL
ncbi:hypothetical protein WICPIJ_007072 [Wickerhamomyces pijperi]|uniref:4-hydroxyphenylpyruvate dioxygenase n=1 Tax=Wickerhamomyces pijperi TaxID=599730 RepID=A0A9P8Q0V6_WICPI|nr:hypothetical protein WICPIJ_007072 [Wickerhamomyces pijperi]